MKNFTQIINFTSTKTRTTKILSLLVLRTTSTLQPSRTWFAQSVLLGWPLPCASALYFSHPINATWAGKLHAWGVPHAHAKFHKMGRKGRAWRAWMRNVLAVGRRVWGVGRTRCFRVYIFYIQKKLRFCESMILCELLIAKVSNRVSNAEWERWAFNPILQWWQWWE